MALCVAVLTALLAPVSAVPVGAADTGTDTDAAGFGAAVYEEQAGDVARFDLSVPNGSTTTLTVDGPAYRTRLDVVDADGDGRVVVRLNTFLAGWRTVERSAYEAAGRDRVAGVTRESPRRSAPLATGPYALGLSGPVDDTARFDLTAATFDAAVPYAVPEDAHPTGATDLRGLDTPNGTVAASDWAVVTFHASGLGGVARLDDAPVRNLVYATDSASGEETTHVVRHGLAVNGSPSTLALDYGAGDGNVPDGLARVSEATLDVGYDTDGDGAADVDVTPSIAHVTVPRSGTVSIALADAPAADAGDDLVIELPVTNPETTGADDVALSVDGQRTIGTVEYGLAGSGALGNGLDLRLAPIDGDSVGPSTPVSPAVHEVFLDERRDTLSVVFDTRVLDRGPHAATLSLTPAHPTVSTPRRLAATVTVVDRRTSFVRPPSSFTVEDETVPVELTTTLAPGSELTLHTSSRSTPNVLQVYVLRVEASRTASVDVRLASRLAGDEVRLAVRENGTVVAGPQVGRPA
ncbi:hypothetical protein [Salinigranum sp. GCM10025319]|uniref:DUF7827 domain-containing protein n=1 Tax=Salinigranum sp. GCM10025319 TaxID=3252687 RepID=UPI00360BC810